MKWKEFRKRMRKNVFTLAEARAVAFDTKPAVLKLELHQWMSAGDLIGVKRGVYAFADAPLDKIEIARALYAPAYVSLEYALNHYGLLPDVVFGVTLVTPKATRTFTTPRGLFIYRRIAQKLFFRFDPATLMGEREKCLLDYLYLNSAQFEPTARCWEELRLQNLSDIDFDKAFEHARAFQSKKLITLLGSIKDYATTYLTH